MKTYPFDAGPTFHLVLGFVAGTATMGACFALGHMIVAGDDAGLFSHWLKKWQTLITGIIALIVGGSTVWYLRTQVNQAHEHEQDRIERKLYAAKTALPAALSSLLDYLDLCFKYYEKFPPHIDEFGHSIDKKWTPPELPQIPSSPLSVIQMCVEFEVQPITREALSWPLRTIQILSSRMRSLRHSYLDDSMPVNQNDLLTESMVDLLEFAVRADKCFDYAREKGTEIDTGITIDELSTKAHRSRIEEDDWLGLDEKIAARVRLRDDGKGFYG